MRSEKTFRLWLILSRVVLVFAGAAVLGLVAFCLFCLNLQSSQTAQANLLGYQFGDEWQYRLVSVLSDGEPVSGQFESPFLKPAPYHLATADGLRGRADYRQYAPFQFEVRHEGDFYFAVLVAQGHELTSGISWKRKSAMVRVHERQRGKVSFNPPGSQSRNLRQVPERNIKPFFSRLVNAFAKHYTVKAASFGNPDHFSVYLPQFMKFRAFHGAIVTQQHGARNTTAGRTSPSTLAVQHGPNKERSAVDFLQQFAFDNIDSPNQHFPIAETFSPERYHFLFQFSYPIRYLRIRRFHDAIVQEGNA